MSGRAAPFPPRFPRGIWDSVFTNVVIILFDELKGVHASPHPVVVVLAHLSWLFMPFVVARVARTQHPFTEEVAEPSRDGRAA
jgi:hypothetical protein